jgi:hypothetical protein
MPSQAHKVVIVAQGVLTAAYTPAPNGFDSMIVDYYKLGRAEEIQRWEQPGITDLRLFLCLLRKSIQSEGNTRGRSTAQPTPVQQTDSKDPNPQAPAGAPDFGVREHPRSPPLHL